MKNSQHDAWRAIMRDTLARLGKRLGFSVRMPYTQEIWLSEGATKVRVPFHFDMRWERPKKSNLFFAIAKSRDAAAVLGQYAQGACQSKRGWHFVMLVPEERMMLRLLAHDLFHASKSGGAKKRSKPTAAVLMPVSRNPAALGNELAARLKRLLQ